MNATTYRWLLASHIEQTRAHLQRLETELEKHDAAEARDNPTPVPGDTTYPYKVDDPDPTEWSDDNTCSAISPGDDDDGGWYCTWPPEHTGDHVAGDGDRVCFVWPQTPPVPVEDLRADDFTDAAVTARLKAAMETHGIRAYSRGLSYPDPKES